MVDLGEKQDARGMRHVVMLDSAAPSLCAGV